MFSLEDLRRMAKVFIVSFLCSEMHSNVSENSAFRNKILYYSTKTNAIKATYNNSQHHASIRLKELDHDFEDGHICSGVVISSSAVLTTGQCVFNYNKNKPYHPSELKVVLASISRYQRHTKSLIFGVTHSYQPETFNGLSLRDNVAILLLERDIPTTNEHVKPIALTRTKIYNTNWYGKQNSDKLKVTTWLKTTEGLSLNHLMLFNASKVKDEICLENYGHSVFNIGMLCVDSNETLNKDFGSPLFIDNKLVGLRSYAFGHLLSAIYTDVSYHANWIHEIIADGSNQNSSIWGVSCFILLTFVAFKRIKFMK